MKLSQCWAQCIKQTQRIEVLLVICAFLPTTRISCYLKAGQPYDSKPYHTCQALHAHSLYLESKKNALHSKLHILKTACLQSVSILLSAAHQALWGFVCFPAAFQTSVALKPFTCTRSSSGHRWRHFCRCPCTSSRHEMCCVDSSRWSLWTCSTHHALP